MKKVTLLLLVILATIVLSGCSPKPFNPPSGAVFVEKDYFSFSYYNGEQEVEIYRFEFINDLYYFDGPFENNINFTAINNYELISEEFTRFINSFDDGLYDRVKADYDGEITLSLKATENNYNEIKIEVEDIYDVDAHYVTEDGLQLIFLYSEFEYKNETIIVPTSVFAFTHEIYYLEDLTVVDSEGEYDYVNFDYTTFLVPVPHKAYSEVISILANDDNNFEAPSKVNKVEYGIGCSGIDDYCLLPHYTSLKVYVDESMTMDDVYDFYETHFNGVLTNDLFTFTVNDELFYIDSVINGDELTYQIEKSN